MIAGTVALTMVQRIECLRAIGLERATLVEYVPLLLAFGSTRSEVEILLDYAERARILRRCR